MKSLFKNIFQLALVSALAIGTTACLEEEMPQDNQQTAGQISKADKDALVSAIPSYMLQYSSSDTYYYDTGFNSLHVWRDAMTADLPVYDVEYDYFTYFNYQLYLGDYGLQTLFWRRYYYLLQKCNSVISVCNPDPNSDDAAALGMALAYRAWAYNDMMRSYEYKSTGVARLDQFAETNGLYGLTVPLVTENTTEADARNLPRAHFTQMYRFIMNDLNKAEVLLDRTTSVAVKNYVTRGVVYGLKARMWLEMGSRFLNHAQDLDDQMAAENNDAYATLDKLQITSANDCFANAATYARKAINENYTPVTQAQWYDPVNGFNTVNDAWMWAIIVNPNNGQAKSLTWRSMVSYLSPDANYGVCSIAYSAYRMIDARLYSEMDKNDWRRDTWIDPNDVGSESAYNAKYAKGTGMSYDEWSEYAAYAGFKFHPAQGARDVSTTGNAIATPLMRIEEMYLIEAEALAHSQGAGAGQAALESFMNTFRMKDGSTFKCKDTSLEGICDNVFRQKRIELWGEGQILWDYRRLEKAIERGYPGTNHVKVFRYNSYENKVAPWTTLYIPDRVNQLNPACKLNPDPSSAIPDLWTE